MNHLRQAAVVLFMLIALASAGTNLPSASTTDPVQISYVVSRLANSTSLYEGSLKGGTALYIHGVGFDPSADNNKIFVGQYPCNTSAKGVTLDTITCDTTAPTSTALYSLPTTVMVNGKAAASCNSASCLFSYTWAATPFLYGVYPRAAAAGDKIKFFGVHRITDLGDGRSNFDNIRGLYIGDLVCSRFDIMEVPIDANSNQYITCAVSPIQAGGYYNITEWVAPGYADKNPRMLYGSINQGVNYEFLVQPRIQTVNSHLGGDQGQTITITGNGFSTNSSLISVKAANIPCLVQSSTENSVTCVVQPNPSGNTFGKLATNTSGTQLQGFLSGSGLKYQRYDISNLSNKNLASFRANINTADVTLVEDSWKSDLMTPDIYGTNYVQVFKGYFVAPTAGAYKFRALADDAVDVFLSNVKGSAEIDYSAPLITALYYSSSLSSRNYYAANSSSLTSVPITLAAGEARYIEVYHLNGYGGGNLLVSVEVPNTNVNLANQVYEVQQVALAPSQLTPEKINFTQTGADTGSMNFRIYRIDPKTYKVLYDVNATIPWDASASSFQNMLNKFDLFYGYNPSVVLTKYDSDGVDISLSAAAGYKYVWTVTINQYRAPSLTAQSFITSASTLSNTVTGSPTPTLTEEKYQAHSPPLEGSFTLSLDNVLVTFYNSTSNATQTDLPYNTNNWDLASWIAQSWNCTYVEVDLVPGKYYVDGVTYIISWIGCPGPKSLIVSNANKMTGGVVGTFPTVSVWRTRAASTNLLVEPVSAEYLFGAASTSQVIVTVNGVQSECQGDCSYVVDPAITPVLASATYNSVTGVMSLNVTDPGSLGFLPNQMIVTLDSTPCTGITSGNTQAMTCTVKSNEAGFPKLRAGSYKPIVEVKNVGFARPSAAVTGSLIPIPLTLTSLSNNTAPLSGGTLVGITGKGFPFDAKAAGLTVNICGTTAIIKTVTNSQIGIAVPPCPLASATSSITVTYNSITSSPLAFTYDPSIVTPSITGVSPNSASPVLKTTMTVTGSGFGTDVSQLTAYLVNGTGYRVYQLNVLTASETSVSVRLSGGLSGVFTVVVNKLGFGDSAEATTGAAQFTYEIVVTNVSPNVGSAAGGTVITITGRNFSPVKANNQVAIGDALNWWCIILTATSTEITCTTPPLSSQYNVLGQNVIVVGRGMIDSTCGGSCTFTYDNATYPTVAAPSSLVYTAGTSYTLTGTGFTNNLVLAKVNVGGTWANVVSATATSVVFIYPALRAGSYALNVYVDGVGYAYSNPPLVSTNNLAPTGLATTTGSTVGNIVTIVGNGLVESTDGSLNLTVTKSGVVQPYTIVKDTPTALGVLLMGGSDGSVYTFTYSYKTQSWAYNYTTLNSSSPKVTLTTNSGVAYNAAQTLSFTRVNFPTIAPNNVSAYPISATGTRFGSSVPLTFTAAASSTVSVNAGALGAGKWEFELFYNAYGYAKISAQFEVLAPTYTVASVTSSYTGGALLTVSGSGVSNLSKLDVAGFPAQLVSYSSNSLVYQVPAYVSRGSQTAYNLVQDGVIVGAPIADTTTKASLAFDKLMSTYYSSSATTCYVGMDFGEYLTADISRIRYFPLRSWKSVGQYLSGATFKASNDNVTWTTLYTIDSTVHTGWNNWRPAAPLAASYRYVKFEHNSTSSCQLAELEISGVLVASTATTATTNTVDVHFSDGFHSTTWAGKVTYQASTTPKVTALSPTSASPAGNNPLTITGTGFGTDSSVVQVLIDNIPCIVTSVIDTQIVCTVGARPNLPAQLSFVVSVSGNIASKTVPDFFYAFRWSDPATWGGDIPPIDGDTVYVPAGMVLLVDQSTPNLQTIIVEGSIIFADEGEMVIETGSIIVNFGVFRAGTEKVPYQNKLTFLLHGSFYDKQLPGFGNKAIGCHCCKFDMYGTPRLKTWSELTATANVGDTSITISDTVDWAVGEVIVIASTSTDHYEAERRTISTIDTVNKLITFDDPLLHQHLSVTETLDATHSFPMRAEVGLLTRNIVVTGDSNSIPDKYGAHIMMHGPSDQGLVGHIAYTEVTQCGQPAIVGRYCIHFHMNGDVSNSYVIGNSVHDSNARILTIHGVHYLTVTHNVGYLIHGHNFFLEDGIETYNVIEHNLVIGTIQVWNMLQTDISAASYWITNPLNTVRYNRAAGGDFYGFWYEIKEHPDGPSATSDICPQGLPVGESHDNIAHSYVRFGLRIFKLFSSTYPCMPPRDNSLLDPWSTNPSIQNTFSNYLLYRCGEAGLLSEETGNTIFDNFTISDSGISGIQFHLTNYSKELVVVQNSVVVGRSTNNGLPLANLSSSFGVITPRSDGFKMSHINFYHFPSVMSVFKSCSICQNELVRVDSGKSSFFEGISYTDVNASYIFWTFPRRDVYYDLDGSLSGTVFDGTARTSATLIPYFAHNDITGQCFNATTPARWDGTHLCGSSSIVRTITFTNGIPESSFANAGIKFARLTSPDQDISAITTGFSETWMVKVMIDKKLSWTAPFVMGNFYNAWWNQGIDFNHMALAPSMYFSQSEPGVVIRFNHTETRELFEIAQIVGRKLKTPFISPQSAQLDPTTCGAGDYYHDTTNKYLYMCVSGKNKPTFTYLDVNGIKCRYLCPQPEGEFVKEPFIRLWSNVTQWPNGVMPAAGDNVTVNGNWTIIMDVNPAPATFLTINGDVFVADRDTTIEAKAIWIRAGSLHAGNASSPFKYKLNIILNGNKNSTSYAIDPRAAGSKFLVVTGVLSLYGQPPSSVWTQLTAKAAAGATSISVANADGWAVGDELAIAPSFNSSFEYEKVTITAISGTTVSITPALSYTHFGDTSPTISNTYGTLDMRTGVGHLTRNITITPGPDVGFGFRVLTYGFLDGTIVRKGASTLVGVRFEQGGQLDTDYAAAHFLSTTGNPSPSLVESCAFVNSPGYSMRLQNNANITVNNNVFYLAKKFIVSVEGQQDYKFTNNLMIGASNRPTMTGAQKDDIACYHQYVPLDFAVDNNLVQNNWCQGSPGEGFVFPHTPCQFLGQATQGFIDNTASSCSIGFMMNTAPNQDCLGGERLKGYANTIGFLTGTPGPSTLQYQGMMFADNGRGMGLRHGKESDHNTGILKDSWISGLARPSCNYCYGPTATLCSNNHALRMMTSTVNGEKFPDKFGPGFDVVCKQESFDSKAFLINVTFDNYRQTYTGAGLTSCRNNVVFKPHPLAFDLTGSHHLTQTKCTNCEVDAYAYFSPPDPNQLGWFGGCGLLLCTGNNNYLVQDHDGSFLGQPGTLVANNSWVGEGESGCTFNPSINGYICFRDDLAVLEYESIAPDFNLRIMWPVTLNYWGGNWTSVTNGWREWEWDANEPLNRRFGRFVSIVRLGQVYNMSFSAQPPSDMRFQIQRRTLSGNASDWLAIRIYYPVANAITVMTRNNVVVDSILATSNEDVTNRTNVCGANKYFYKNGTIAFIVTGDAACQVRVTLNSNVQITARLMVNINTFFDNGGVATFVDRMCAFLNITTDRLKVVGVYEGSTVLDAVVTAPINTTVENSTTTTVNPVEVRASLQAIADKLTNAASGSINLGGVLGPIVSTTATVSIINTDGSQYTDPVPPSNTDTTSNSTTIIIAVVVSVLSAALIGVTTWLVIKKIRSRGAIQPEATGDRSNNEFEVQKDVEVVDMEMQERDISENKSNIRLDH